MKKLSVTILILAFILLLGCSVEEPRVNVVATTLPVYDFSLALCEGTGLTVGQLITDSISCLHDYSLSVRQMRTLRNADVVVISGAGLEDFLDPTLFLGKPLIDASIGIEAHCNEHTHKEADTHHHHEQDPHIWLSPENAKTMARNICDHLSSQYPAHSDTLHKNLVDLLAELDALQEYGQNQLADLQCREMITFHDGFGYLAESFELEILQAIEEESGSEASAEELKKLILLVKDHRLPAVFTEENGSASAASILKRETGVCVFSLDMALSGTGYLDAMYHNINTIKEALG